MSKHNPKNKNQKVIYSGGRVVGVVRGGVFEKTVKSSKHFLREPRAIAFDETSLGDAQVYGASQVKVNDADTGRVFTASMKTILESGFSLNRGYGNQIALTLEHWRVGGSNGGNELPEPTQLALI